MSSPQTVKKQRQTKKAVLGGGRTRTNSSLPGIIARMSSECVRASCVPVSSRPCLGVCPCSSVLARVSGSRRLTPHYPLHTLRNISRCRAFSITSRLLASASPATPRQRPAGRPPPRPAPPSGGGQPLVPRRLEERAAGPDRLRPPLRAHALPGQRARGHPRPLPLIQQVGGVANGSTWYDRTNYYETLPSEHSTSASGWSRTAWASSCRRSTRRPRQPARRGDERAPAAGRNQPYGRADERLHELLYPAEHPYHWPVIGYMEDIAAAAGGGARLLPHLLHARQRGADAGGRLRARAAPSRGSSTSSARSRPAPRPPVGAPPPLGGERRDAAAGRRPAWRASTSASRPAYGTTPGTRPTCSRPSARRRQVEPALPRPRLRAPDRPGRRRLVGPTRARAPSAWSRRRGRGWPPLEEALLEHLAGAASAARPSRHRARAQPLLTDYYSALQQLDSRPTCSRSSPPTSTTRAAWQARPGAPWGSPFRT